MPEIESNKIPKNDSPYVRKGEEATRKDDRCKCDEPEWSQTKEIDGEILMVPLHCKRCGKKP